MTEDRRVRITEVGPRDGLQNESAIVPVAEKIAFVDALGEAGFPEIEVTSFVSPKWVPQLADAAEVMSGIERKASITYSVLCPNQRGAEAALAAGADKLSIFTSASEGFCRKNLNASIEESIEKLSFDLYYIKNLSIFLDLSIMASTLRIVLVGRGSR